MLSTDKQTNQCYQKLNLLYQGGNKLVFLNMKANTRNDHHSVFQTRGSLIYDLLQ